MSSTWRPVLLTLISLCVSFGVLIAGILVVALYEEARHVTGPGNDGSAGIVMGIFGLPAFFVVYPVITIAVASFESGRMRRVPRWKKHGCVLLALVVLSLWFWWSASGRSLDALSEVIGIVYAPLAMGWLVYSEAMDQVRTRFRAALAPAGER